MTNFALGFLAGLLLGPLCWLCFKQLRTARHRDEEDKVEAAFPGWSHTVRTERFEKWLASQPREVISKVDSRRSEDAIAVLRAYYESKGAPK